LSALGRCIEALSKEEGFIPYRNSKLTLVLRESLGGNSKTMLLIACSPDIYNIDETKSTLRFGKNAKQIKNKVVENLELSPKDLKDHLDKISKYVKKKKLELYIKVTVDEKC